MKLSVTLLLLLREEKGEIEKGLRRNGSRRLRRQWVVEDSWAIKSMVADLHSEIEEVTL